MSMYVSVTSMLVMVMLDSNEETAKVFYWCLFNKLIYMNVIVCVLL